jgi:hypothetical protein
MVQSPRSSLSIDAKVAELIDSGVRGWNVPLIQAIFSQEEAKLICNLPLRRYHQQDKLIW